MATISGYIERITYYNEENGFVVAKLQEKGKRELTTIVGNLAVINPGESLKLTGQWVHNKKFGEQFQVETSEITVPATVVWIRKYLGSGMIKGVGPVLADRIVEKFGLDTLDVIEKSPNRLSEAEGIGPKRIEMIIKAWEEQKGIKEIMIFLQGHGVSPAFSAKIYKHYGNRSIEGGSAGAAEDTDCTTHIGVTDGQRNMVSFTNTAVSLFGARMVVPGTGILLQNGMIWFDPEPGRINSIAPGKRPLGNMVPVSGLPAGRAVLHPGGARREEDRVGDSADHLEPAGRGRFAAGGHGGAPAAHRGR